MTMTRGKGTLTPLNIKQYTSLAAAGEDKRENSRPLLYNPSSAVDDEDEEGKGDTRALYCTTVLPQLPQAKDDGD